MMKGSYRPTLLKIASRHCAGAIQHYLDNTPTDREAFAAGTAAHLVLQGVADATGRAGRVLTEEETEAIADKTAKRLISEGREFDGDPEGPLSPDSVILGRRLALEYLSRHPIEDADGAEVEELYAEIGMAVGEDWKPVEYSKGARFRLIADQMSARIVEDEDSFARVLVVRDYKSAWPTGEEELDTVQLKAQAVLAFLHHGDDDIDAVRQEVVNLRTGRTYSRDIWLGSGGRELLEEWRKEIEIVMDGLDAGRVAGRYVCTPGGGCVGCPYALRCDVAAKYWGVPDSAWNEKDYTIGELAAAFAWIEGARAELIRRLKKAAVKDPIRIGEYCVGYQPKQKNAVVKDVGPKMLKAWEEAGGDAEGFAAAIRPGVSQVSAWSEAMNEDKEKAAELAAGMMTKKPSKLFGVWKEKD